MSPDPNVTYYRFVRIWNVQKTHIAIFFALTSLKTFHQII